jgi:glycosyltransferase involved in cell wall biosynthesis
MNYSNIEVICVDDCSRDESRSIIQEYVKKDRRIHLFCHDTNIGAGVARNTGIKHSKGKYLFFLDADDFIAEGALQTMVKMAELQKCDMVRGKITGTTNEGNRYELAAEHLLHDKTKHYVHWRDEESLWFYWYFTANLYRTEFVKRNRIIFPRGLRNEDPFFLCRCFLSAENISLYPEIVYHYRVGPEQKKKTPTVSFLTGWSLGNYYLYQLFQAQHIPAQFFMIHFPSLITHSLNVVDRLDKPEALRLLKYIYLIFRNANLEYYEKPESQPWKHKRRFREDYRQYVGLFAKSSLNEIYEHLISYKGTP